MTVLALCCIAGVLILARIGYLNRRRYRLDRPYLARLAARYAPAQSIADSWWTALRHQEGHVARRMHFAAVNRERARLEEGNAMLAAALGIRVVKGGQP